jgi:hypothetical protein
MGETRIPTNGPNVLRSAGCVTECL